MKALRRVSILIGISLALTATSHGLGQRLQAEDIRIFDGEIPPGEYVAFQWNGKRFVPWEVPEINLTRRAKRAVKVSPEWIRADLSSKLQSLAARTQDSLADIILTAYPELIDEIAFTITHISAREFTDSRFDPRIIAENARLIYEADSLFDYVELTDYGEPKRRGDWKTTARYRLKGQEGSEEYYELPFEVYYWYVAFPRLGRERAAYVDPLTGEYASPDSGGVFWRDYLLHESKDPKASFSRHFLTKCPNLIQEVPADIQDAELALTDFLIDPIPLVTDSNGSPLLCSFSWPGNQLDGEVIATTIPFELEGSPTGLFENLLRAGSASALLDTTILPEGFIDIRIAVLKDRDPFGKPTIERALDSLGYPYQVFTSDEIGKMLTADTGFIKIIIPSGQPRSFYKKLTETDSLWQVWMSDKELSYNRVVQFHGAGDPSYPGDNWQGLKMPWGFRYEHRKAGEASIAGYPKLKGLLSKTDYLWDSRPMNIPGDEPLSKEASVMEVTGYFVTQNLPDRCAEIPYYYRGADLDTAFEGDASDYVQSLRSRYPHCSLYLHYGNCGEMMNLLSAASRTALVPVRNMIAYPVDHVWNQVYLEGKWRTYTAFRSDRGIRFADGVYEGKNHYAVMGSRSDGCITNCISDYFDSTFIAEVHVTDSAGRPVDGATVTIMTQWYHGDPPPKIHAGIGWTDLNGVAQVELGTKRDYFVQLFTPIADFPELAPDTSERAREDTIPRDDPVLERRRGMRPEPIPLVSKDDEITPGDTILHEVSLPFMLPQYRANADSTIDLAADTVPHLVLKVPECILHSYSSYSGCNFTRRKPQGSVNLYVMDSLNLERFAADKPFAPDYSFENADQLDFFLPSWDDDWFLVLSNRHRMSYGQVFRLDVVGGH